MKFVATPAVETSWEAGALSIMSHHNLDDDLYSYTTGETISLKPGEVIVVGAKFCSYELVILGSVEEGSDGEVSELERVVPESLIEFASSGRIVPMNGEAYDWLVARGVELAMERPGGDAAVMDDEPVSPAPGR